MLHYNESVKFWQKAIDALPAQLSPVEVKQKEQYEEGLKGAKRRLEDSEKQSTYIRMLSSDKIPWKVAKALLPELQARGQAGAQSSAWVISAAYDEWKEGIDYLNGLKRIPVPGSQQYRVVGCTQGLASLSNGILRDSRIFHIDDPKFVEKYNEQVMFEVQALRAFSTEGVEGVIEKAQKRQREEGWDSIRPALSTTVRAWIMQGFVVNGLKGEPELAASLLKSAVDFLCWGREAWKDVPDTNRGTIFSDTFLRGVRTMYLDMLHNSYCKNPRPDALQAVYDEAKDLLEDASAAYGTITGNYDPGFVFSFYLYPQGSALAMMGYYHGQLGDQAAETDEEKRSHYMLAAEKYAEAAMMYPEDDEQRAWYLSCAMGHMWKCPVPIRALVTIGEKLRAAAPKMRRIWENSQLAKGGRDKSIKFNLDKVDEALAAVSQGKVSLDDYMALKFE